MPGDFADRSASRRAWTGVAIAVGAAAAGLALRLALAPMLGERSIFLFFVPAVVLASAVGGLWPGVLATALGVAGGAFSTVHSGGVVTEDLASAAVFGVVCGAIVTGGEWFQRGRR